MRKIISSVFVFLVFSILLVLPSDVSAQDVWVYSSGGRNYYVMTETIDYGQRAGTGGDGFSVYTKMTGNNNGEVLKIHWSFKVDGRYKSNLGSKGNLNNESDSTLARSVFDYCINYINTHR